MLLFKRLEKVSRRDSAKNVAEWYRMRSSEFSRSDVIERLEYDAQIAFPPRPMLGDAFE